MGANAGFIIAAYGVVAIVVGLLVAWVAIDFRKQKRALAELEARGITRRAAR
ncbi:MAG TPA: heme exporter protein CcmD [Xanthobacteraceae bacterium]